MIVAIDGPAGSGKSTVARIIARDRGFTYLDTGAMYRALTVLALGRGADLDDEAALSGLAAENPVTFGRGSDGVQSVAIAGRDVTRAIRTPEVDANVSRVARLPRVREAMVARQRELAAGSDAVAEGRDIGTVVFPEAEVKVFLTASPEARAHRRFEQNAQRGMAGTSDEGAVLDAILRRDEMDSTRAASPLRPAEDAVRIDSSALGVDEVTRAVLELVDAARAARPEGE